MLESCGDRCGWAAALLSCFAFGTFGVPMKSDAANRVDVDPLVFQSYKTAVCLLTAPLVPLTFGREYLTFTPWGIVSGLFWVPAGVAAVYAVRSPAGLAASQGTWSSVIVLVSFVWGIGVFGESVRSLSWACAGVGLMIAGLWGMSYFSSPKNSAAPNAGDNVDPAGVLVTREDAGDTAKKRRCGEYEGIEDVTSSESFDDFAPEHKNFSLHQPNGGVELTHHGMMDQEQESQPSAVVVSPGSPYVLIAGCRFSHRQLGLASAVFNGVWGGSIMVPMHYARGNTSGLGYVVSFAVGATVVTAFLWLCRFCYHLARVRSRWSITMAYGAMPSFHLRTMGLPGGVAGALWSLGNVCSMVSVEFLGEGVGYSVLQASMLVSGLWGIFWFREVVGTAVRAKWLMAALVTVIGILTLSYEHVKTK